MPLRFFGDSLILSNKVQTRLIDYKKSFDYAWLFAIASLPVVLSLLFGVAFTRRLTYTSTDGLNAKDCLGYLACFNWYSLVVTLPMALYVVRFTARRLFDLDRNPNAHIGIPNLLTPEKAAEDFRDKACNGLNLIAALAITLIIHIFDMKY